MPPFKYCDMTVEVTLTIKPQEIKVGDKVIIFSRSSNTLSWSEEQIVLSVNDEAAKIRQHNKDNPHWIDFKTFRLKKV